MRLNGSSGELPIACTTSEPALPAEATGFLGGSGLPPCFSHVARNIFWNSATTGPSIRTCVSAPRRPPFRAAGRAFPERASGIDAADVDAADERGAAIDDQQLAVIAMIHVPALPGGYRTDRIELEHPDARVDKPL